MEFSKFDLKIKQNHSFGYLKYPQSITQNFVAKFRTNDVYRIVELENGAKFKFPLSSSITLNDQILHTDDGLFVICKNGTSKIHPLYEEQDFFHIGNEKYPLLIKQITDLSELEEQKYLESFHYRNRNTFGKNAKLIAVSNDNRLPKVLGYIELNIASIMNKARNQVLDSYYNDGYLKWDKWDFATRGKFSKAIVTISRVVVHPEFRGLDIGKLLLKHAFSFAKDYWQVNGVKPIFIEIVADMLKFIPFAKNSGMLFVGNTEGNVKRLGRDLKYYIKHKKTFLKKDQKNSLVRMQSHYVKRFLQVLEQNELDINDILHILKNYEEGKIRTNLSFLNGIIRFPKPTYLIGLNYHAQSFLEKRIYELGINEEKRDVKLSIEPINSPIIFDDVSISFQTSLKLTEKIQTIKESFGIIPEQLKSIILSNFKFSINPGEIILITGASGTGKTVILDAIEGKIKPDIGKVILPSNSKIGLLNTLSNKKPLIELIGKSVNESLYILNKSGLSEAYLYLRKFNELSNGQQYRAMIAKLIDGRYNIWLADEFLNSLDSVTANIVASNIRNLAKKLGITLIVVSADCNNFIESLKPDKVLIKEFGYKYRLNFSPIR